MSRAFSVHGHETESRDHIMFHVIVSNTRRLVSSNIQTLRSRLKKRGAADFEVFGYLVKHFRMFDMASQTINDSWRNSGIKLAKFCGNWERISKPRSQ